MSLRSGVALFLSTLLVGGVSGCMRMQAPAAAASAPEIKWVACQGAESIPEQYKTRFAKLECGTLNVPLDYAKPDGEQLPMGVLRVKAAGDRLGSLVLNPGGPGGSGVEYLFQGWLGGVFDTLNSRYDLVSFDPRGVGSSTPVTCLDAAGNAAFLQLDHTPRTDAQIKAFTDGELAYKQGCQEHSGTLLPFVGTVSAAKDMDQLRQALGDEKFNFLGISYGTWLGAKYANEFPDRVGRMVLDSAVDPTLSQQQLDSQQATSQEANLDALLDDCVAQGAKCALHSFGTSRPALRAKIQAFSEQLDAKPMSKDGRTLSQEMFLQGLGSSVGAASQRSQVGTALAAGMNGDPTALIAMADSATGRQANGTFDNIDAANRAVRCADDQTHYSVDEVKGQVAAFRAAAPLFGTAAAWDGLRCLDWPYAGDNAAKDVTAPDSATTIVVVGSTGDPETPYAWSPALAKQLGNAQLITNKGPYHGAYLSGATCVQEKVNAYLFEGTLPGNTTCG